MITKDCVERVLPVVADSWDRLRGCDVYRLLNQIGYENIQGLADAANVILGKRPDLAEDVSEAANELHEELFAIGCERRNS